MAIESDDKITDGLKKKNIVYCPKNQMLFYRKNSNKDTLFT